jgi:glycine/D-amino acid oxidase-like deaminating enzyme
LRLDGEGAGHGPWWEGPPTADQRRSYADAASVPYRLDNVARAPLEGEAACELAIIGGGLSGLWAALLAKQDERDREVLVLEGDRIANAASGRNGGLFFSAGPSTGGPRPDRRSPDRSDPAARDPVAPGSVSARAASLGGDRAHPPGARRRRSHRGRRGLWLRALDRLGLGFDS